MVSQGFPLSSKHGFEVASAHGFRGAGLSGWRFPDAWALCKASAPTTNYENEVCYASTRTKGVWSDESRSVFKFNKLALGAINNLNFGRIGAYLAGTPHSGLLRNSLLSGLGIVLKYDGPLRTVEMFAKARLTPILNDFDTSLITWNGLSGLSLGASFDVLGEGTKNEPVILASTVRDRDTFYFFPDNAGQTSTISFAPTNDISVGLGGISVAGSGVFYGFIMDVLFDYTASGSIDGLELEGAYFGIAAENNNTVF